MSKSPMVLVTFNGFSFIGLSLLMQMAMTGGAMLLHFNHSKI